MSRPQRSANDPFEILVELTAAAISRHPPAEFAYEPVGPTLFDRLATLFERDGLPRPEGSLIARSDPALEPGWKAAGNQ